MGLSTRALLLLLWLPASTWAATVSYTSDTSDFANPERGFSVTDYYWGPGNGQNRSLTAANMSSDDSSNPAGESNITLVRRIYVLSGYTGSTLDSTVLSDISNDFTAARSLGIKLVPRFAYNWVGQNGSGSADATQARILGHISQLTSILQANDDVIAYMEAGFIGQWGEWHDSTNALTDGSNSNSTAAMSTILNAILTALPTDRMVAVRYPGYTLEIFGTTSPISAANAYNGSNYSRCGVHDDCFAVDQYDAGTYAKGTSLGWSVAQFKSFLAQQVYSISVGGETCGATDPYSTCANSTADLQSLHWSMLNSQYDSANINEWSSGGCLSTIKNNLGYRFRLTQSTAPASANAGSSLAVSFQVTNDGYANCYNPRNLEIILRPTGQTGTGTALPVVESTANNTDPRFWLPGQTYTVNATVTVPGGQATGTYDLLLNLPDGKASLYGKPAYAIRLADTGVWESATGYNKLNQSLSVVSCPACTATPTYTASATPVPGSGSIISIDFVGGSATNGTPSSMGAAESAGVVSAANWNSAAGVSGSLADTVDNLAGSTGASLAFSASNGIWSTAITEAAGNARMMKGYIDALAATAATVQISNLPSRFTSSGYSVYVYFDGDNGTATRTGNYTIGSTTISGSDAASANFAGSFTQASGGSNGNYVLFTGLSAATFTLSAQAGASTDAYPRAPINGIQIVANPVVNTPTRTPAGSPSSTATATRSATVTPTPSFSASASKTVTLSSTPTVTPTATPSSSASATRTATLTGTRSATASATATASFTSSPTNSPGPSATQTASPTASKTATASATASVTPSTTSTASPSATRTATPSSTRTATPTATVTTSFTGSPTNTSGSSPTPSVTPTVTRTSTPTATPTSTLTDTRTATASVTATLSFTGSPTNTTGPSATQTYTPTVTRTATPTATESSTRTATATLSSTPTLSNSPSASPTLTGTRSATVSPTVTTSFTDSPTITFGPSPTSTMSPTVSRTYSPSPTLSSTPSVSSTPSLTATSSYTLTASPSLTVSASPSQTLSVTATQSGTASMTPSPVDTATQAATATLTATLTRTAQPTGTATPSVSSTATATPLIVLSPSPSPSASPGKSGSSWDIVSVVPIPNPNPHSMDIKLEGSADAIELRFYSRAMVCMLKLRLEGAWHSGWNNVPLPSGWDSIFAGGQYFLWAQSQRSGASGGKPRTCSFVIIR